MEKVREGMKNCLKKSFVMVLVSLLLCGVGGEELRMAAKAETMVYVTSTGKKYHAKKCGSGKFSKCTLSQAKSKGLTACKKCYPNGAPNDKAKEKPLKLNCTSKVLIVGQTFSLKATAPSGKVTWKSSKASIAKVDKKGKVTAVKKGKAKITATCNGKSKSCTVTVEKPYLSKTSVTIEEGEVFTLTLKGCSHSKIKWTSSDKEVLEVKNGKVETMAPGTATVTAQSHGKKYTCKVTVTEYINEDDVDDVDDDEDVDDDDDDVVVDNPDNKDPAQPGTDNGNNDANTGSNDKPSTDPNAGTPGSSEDMDDDDLDDDDLDDSDDDLDDDDVDDDDDGDDADGTDDDSEDDADDEE